MSLTDTDKRFCSILFDVMKEKGVKDVVCSPGSRNAPLLIAAASRDELKKHIVTDERSAAFMALGMALVSRRPVALICTSGTALLNYGPAVAEAYYQGVPLIVISADRPEQWIDQDDSQTLRQEEALNNFVKKSYSLPAWGDDDKELRWYANRISNDAMAEATGGKPGPIHINVRLGEPLGRKIPVTTGEERVIKVIEADSIGNKEIIKELGQRLSKSKVMLVAGFMAPDSILQKAVGSFVKFPNVAVMAETLSNLHLEEDDYSVDSVLTAYSEDELDKYAPEIVISIGGALVSRKLKEYLRRNSGKCEHWSIGRTHTTTDCFMALRLRIETEMARFFRNITRVISKVGSDSSVSGYKTHWKQLREAAGKIKQDYIDRSGWSELKAFDILLNNLDRQNNLFLSNGTPVRYAQIIKYKLPHASYCNRGVSGIDGSVSTAVGAAKAYKEGCVIITGDLSMSYDIGSLALPEIPDRMKIIVIDNQGGGIFRFIPATYVLEEREEYFCGRPNLPLKELAEGYGFDYFEAKDEESLHKNLERLQQCCRKAIMRIVCDGEISAEKLKGFMNCRVIKLSTEKKEI